MTLELGLVTNRLYESELLLMSKKVKAPIESTKKNPVRKRIKSKHTPKKHQPRLIEEVQPLYIACDRTCECPKNNLNCMSAKEWLKCQLGVWKFSYEGRDIRDKEKHPATFPIALAKRVIELFTHKGELVLDPFVGSGTTLVAAQDTDRNAVGFDLQKIYVDLSTSRLGNDNLFNKSKQLAICGDARDIQNYLLPETVSLIFTSQP